MRILHICFTSDQPAVEQVCRSFHTHLLRAGIDSQVITPASKNRWLLRKRSDLDCRMSDLAPYKQAIQEAGLIHVHGNDESVFSLFEFRKPILWTAHDAWPVTGGCQRPSTCQHFRRQCHDCPVIQSSRVEDQSFRQFTLRTDSYAQARLAFHSVNPKVQRTLAKSPFAGRGVSEFMPPIDVDFWSPAPRNLVRQTLDLPQSTPVIGMLSEQVIPPSALPTDARLIGPTIINTGIAWSNDLMRRQALQSCDVVLTDDMLNAQEALSCGTPVVSLGHALGGVIRHQRNGFYLPPFESDDIKLGVEWCLLPDNRTTMALRCRADAMDRFSPESVIADYNILCNNL